MAPVQKTRSPPRREGPALGGPVDGPVPQQGSEDGIASSFDRYFSVCLATDRTQRELAQGIRFRVYCEEFGYENPNTCPGRLEVDEYDEWSTHALVMHRESGLAAACVRMVPTRPEVPGDKLPYEKYCRNSIDQAFVDSLNLDRSTVCEISRLAVDGSFRRRGKQENLTRFGHVEHLEFSADERRTLPLIAVAAFLAATAITHETGRTNVFAMMEPFLPRLMSRSGIHFDRAGQDIEYHGQRAPYFTTTQSALATMHVHLRKLYEIIHAQLYPGQT
jgi:N-acyl amino acid synthase of PEP-CTERM/exosortase system